MKTLTIRNVPDEVHRALRIRAARHGRSAEAEIREILEKAARPDDRIKLGTMLLDIGRHAGLDDDEVDAINQLRDKTTVVPADFS